MVSAPKKYSWNGYFLVFSNMFLLLEFLILVGKFFFLIGILIYKKIKTDDENQIFIQILGFVSLYKVRIGHFSYKIPLGWFRNAK